MSQSFTGTTAIQTPFLKETIVKTLCFVCSRTLAAGATLQFSSIVSNDQSSYEIGISVQHFYSFGDIGC